MPAASRSAAALRKLASPQDAQAQGVATIYQELNLLPNLSVAENVFIGREPGGRAFRQLAPDGRGDARGPAHGSACRSTR